MRRLVIFLVLFLCGCARSTPADPVFLARVELPPALDKSAERGTDVGLARINGPDGGILGRDLDVYPIEPREDPEQLQAVAVRYLAVNRVAALLGGSDADELDRLARATQPYDAPVITATPLAPGVNAEGVYSLAPSVAVYAKAIAKLARDHLKVDSLALVGAPQAAFTLALREALESQNDAARPLRISIFPYAADLTPAKVADDLKKSQTKSALFLASPMEFAALREALAAQGIKIPAIVTDRVGALSQMSRAVQEAGPLYQVTCYSADALSPAGKEFAKAYETRFGLPPDVLATQAYDAVQLTASALRRAKQDGVKLRAELQRTWDLPFESCTGPLVFDPKGRTAVRPLFLIKLEDGKARLLDKVEPAPVAPAPAK